MANLDFFGVRDDLAGVLEFLYSETDVRVFDSYSPFGKEIREYRSVAEFEEHHELGINHFGIGGGATLKLWSPSVMAQPTTERITLDRERCNGHSFRYSIKGGGLIQLIPGGLYKTAITKTSYSHNSQRRAEVWKVDEGTDWAALSKLSNKIQYHIRKRLAVAKVASDPILPQAYELARQGFELKEFANSPWRWELAGGTSPSQTMP